MIGNRLTARARLTLVYAGLFAAGGIVVVATTYFLVAHSLPTGSQAAVAASQSDAAKRLLAQCSDALRLATKPVDPNLKAKCGTTFQQGLKLGASSQRGTTLSHLLVISSGSLILVTALAAVAGWVVAGRVLRPVHQLTAAARAASEHNLSHRLALGGPHDELRELADTFDDMLARLDTAFASQRLFIANASHELRTPLTVMRTTIDVVLAKPAPTVAELAAMGADVRVAVGHAEALIEALLTLARTEGGLTVSEVVDLATVAEDVVDAIPAGGPTVAAHLAPATTTGDPVLLERLVANLVDNARRYNVPGGTVAVSTAAGPGGAVLRVANTGPPLTPELLDHLFEPFTRAEQRTASNGFGLGLALVHSIATAHGARVAVSAPPAGGLDITVTFPRAGLAAAAPAAEAAA